MSIGVNADSDNLSHLYQEKTNKQTNKQTNLSVISWYFELIDAALD